MKQEELFEQRLKEHYDELKWLYCELYGSMDMFYRLCRTMKDFFVRRKDSLKPLHFRILVNGEFLNNYTADGMIIATPTGSTAYNLSAGGPIVAPKARMMVLTPICCHALNARSIVLGADDQITVQVEEEGHMAAFDGNPAGPLFPGDEIHICQSRLDTVLVQLKKVSFLQNLSSKMARI